MRDGARASPFLGMESASCNCMDLDALVAPTMVAKNDRQAVVDRVNVVFSFHGSRAAPSCCGLTDIVARTAV